MKHWRIPEKESEDFVDAMEDVLDAYAREYGDDEVLVCVDETSVRQTAKRGYRFRLLPENPPSVIMNMRATEPRTCS